MQLSSWIQFLHLRPKECNKNGWSETKFCISNDKWHQVGCKTKWNYWSDNSTPPCSDGQQYRWIFFYHLPQWSPPPPPWHPNILQLAYTLPLVTPRLPNIPPIPNTSQTFPDSCGWPLFCDCLTKIWSPSTQDVWPIIIQTPILGNGADWTARTQI